jgi:hypothetical protein
MPMRKTITIVDISFLFLCVVLALSGCQTLKTTPAPVPTSALIWQVQVSKFEIKDGLKAVESVTQYNGSKIDVEHSQSPEAGDVYLIMEVTIRKTGNQSTPFDWQWLVVRDASGNAYHRLANDTFLEQYQYTPRITGLQLRLGEYAGWMCYEIPASAATGKITLAYTAEGSQQETVLKK